MDQIYLNARQLLASGDKQAALTLFEMIANAKYADDQLKDFAQDDINRVYGFNVKRYNELMATAPQ